MPRKEYDWPDMKAKYETGGYTYASLAKEYGGNRKYIARVGKREGWEKAKRRDIMDKEAAKKVMDQMSTSESEIRVEFAKIFKMLRDKTVDEVMLMYKDTERYANSRAMTAEDIKALKQKLSIIASASEERLKAMRAATHVINNCRQNEWEIYEIQEVAKKVEQDIRGDLNVNDAFTGLSVDEIKEMIKELD